MGSQIAIENPRLQGEGATTLECRIPDPKTRKPDLTLGRPGQKNGRIKFYQLEPAAQNTVHDQPRQ